MLKLPDVGTKVRQLVWVGQRPASILPVPSDTLAWHAASSQALACGVGVRVAVLVGGSVRLAVGVEVAVCVGDGVAVRVAVAVGVSVGMGV